MSRERLERLERTGRALREHDLDILLVGPGPDLRWLVGYEALPLERLTLLGVPAEGDPWLVVPELEAPRARASGADELVDLVTWPEDRDPFLDVAERVGPSARGAAVGDHLWSAFLLRLQERLRVGTWRPGSEVVGPLRLRKTAEEVELLRAAAQAIDRVHARVPELLGPGRREREVGRDIADLIVDEHDTVNFVIVASGPNGASPHHETGARRLERGDAVVVDIGGTRDGYCSDATRNYAVGDVPDGYAELHEVLQQAQHAAVSAVRPGVAAEEVDRVARDAIDGAGYVGGLLHRTGHGIGVEEHEAPYLVAGATEPLRPGMVFSVEPGIYLEGRYGARIEDIVAVTEQGVERLNTRSRELVVVDA